MKNAYDKEPAHPPPCTTYLITQMGRCMYNSAESVPQFAVLSHVAVQPCRPQSLLQQQLGNLVKWKTKGEMMRTCPLYKSRNQTDRTGSGMRSSP